MSTASANAPTDDPCQGIENGATTISVDSAQLGGTLERLGISEPSGGGIDDAAVPFEANITQVLDIMIKSLYDCPEVFLRELVSNASDALDKRRFAEVSGDRVASDDPYEISVVPDPAKGTLAVSDSGVGMTPEELRANLGRIGESGTRQFADRMATSKDTIGHFGVGFYSAFLVADAVTVHTRTPSGGDAVWHSDGRTGFTLKKDFDSPMGASRTSGTVVVLHLREDRAAEYTNGVRVGDVLKRHSQFLHHRVMLKRVQERRMPDGKGGHAKKTMMSWDVVTKVPPVWAVEEPTQADHDKFCLALTGNQDHLAHDLFRVEGDFSFSVAMYVPESCSFDLFSATRDRHARNTRLFCRGVFISDDCAEVCPAWLSFLQIAVSADDLDLHVGRSTMQQRVLLSVIEKQVVTHAVAMLERMAGDKEVWDKFWKTYSKELRLGVHDDERHRERLAALCSWPTLLRPTEPEVTLADFAARGEGSIYFVTGEGPADQLARSPCLEGLLSHGVDALLLTQPIDEYVSLRLTQFSGRQLANASRAGTQFPWGGGGGTETKRAALAPLCASLTKMLGCPVQETDALSTSPCCVVTQGWTHTANMRRIMSSQAMGKTDAPPEEAVVLLNASHQGVMRLQEDLLQMSRAEQPQAGAQQEFENTVRFMVETARLASGFNPVSPQQFAAAVWKRMF